jgi:1,4-alpha-glucan branching enzyme
VWLHETNAWIYPHLQTAARRMVEAAQAETKGAGFARRASAKLGPETEAITERLLKQMARELLLAQSSDWAFLMKTGTATHYAAKRTRDHVLRFTRLYEQWRSGALDLEFLANCEWRDDLFPHVNWRYYV